MAGLNQDLINKVLGYDDNYTSNEARRAMYWADFNGFAARPHEMISLSMTRPCLRAVGNEAEYVVQKIVVNTFIRMMTVA